MAGNCASHGYDGQLGSVAEFDHMSERNSFRPTRHRRRTGFDVFVDRGSCLVTAIKVVLEPNVIAFWMTDHFIESGNVVRIQMTSDCIVEPVLR